MNEETLKRLDALAVKVGVTAQYLWSVLVKQARVEMWKDIAAAALFLVLAYSLWKLAVVLWNRDEGDDRLGCLFCVVGIAIFSILLFICALNAFTEGINPDYWALNKILGSLKP